jgi:hypothetical protein
VVLDVDDGECDARAGQPEERDELEQNPPVASSTIG